MYPYYVLNKILRCAHDIISHSNNTLSCVYIKDKTMSLPGFRKYRIIEIDFIDDGQITQKLKEQEFSFLPMTHSVIS